MTMVNSRFGVFGLPWKPFTRNGLQGLRVCRSQRRSYRLRHVRRSGTAEPTVESSTLTLVVVLDAALTHGVVVSVMASVVTEVGYLEARKEHGRDDEHDARDDHNPRREPVEPIGFDRQGRWLGGDGGRPGWDFRCFAHTSNDAWATNRVRWVQLMKYL
jgi:hypothetical protein